MRVEAARGTQSFEFWIPTTEMETAKEISMDERVVEHQDIVIGMRRQGPSQIAFFIEKETQAIVRNFQNAVYKTEQHPEVDLDRLDKIHIKEALLDIQPSPDLLQKQMDSSARCDKILQCLEMMEKK